MVLLKFSINLENSLTSGSSEVFISFVSLEISSLLLSGTLIAVVSLVSEITFSILVFSFSCKFSSSGTLL